jgi:hypothetical protein
MQKNVIIALLFFIGISTSRTYSQSESEFTKRPVSRFFELLFKSEDVSINEFTEIFGKEAILLEENAYMDSCRRLFPNADCLKKMHDEFEDLNAAKSYVFRKYKCTIASQYQNLDKSVFDVINQAIWLSKTLVLNFEEGNMYFSLGYEEDMVTPIIFGIYNTEGALILNSEDFLKLRGGIVDRDGFVNVREMPSISGEIVQKLHVYDFIWYTPSTLSNWWRVYGIDQFRFLGYVHKSRIEFFDYLSKSQKLKIIERNVERHEWLQSLRKGF